MATEYTLAQGRYARAIGDTAVVMDIANDKYFCLPGKQAAWLLEITGRDNEDTITREASRFAKRLCELGILTEALPTDTRIERIALERPVQTQRYARNRTAAQIRLSHVVAITIGFILLGHLQHSDRRNPLRIFASVERWKARVRQHAQRPLDEVYALADAFEALAPWFFSLHDACFFKSLLLIHFLARHGVSADWTFAVRLSPFRAHCWVAFEGVFRRASLTP